jgi:hypothetical protein
MTGAQVRYFIMSNIIDVVLVDELVGDDPRCFRKNLIYPSAMSDGLNPDNDEVDGEVL